MGVVTIPRENTRIDLLDRQEFVDQMLTIAKSLSDNKKNACYAVNGDWGIGKSFVLDMFEEQAKEIGKEGEELPRYLIFRYNCWEYDYYDEPLVAMVASMLDQISENVNMIPIDIKATTVAVLKAVGKELAKKAIQVIEDKTGINIENIAKTAAEGLKDAEKEVQKLHEYDQYSSFKKNLKTLQETIRKLSENQTVIFIVDELDRCLPEYAIKVLERLHHLFRNLPNTQVILSLDMTQLEQIVSRIYGERIKAKQYLHKFIGFQIDLDVGTVNDKFDELFQEYSLQFDHTENEIHKEEIVDFKKFIFDGIDARKRVSLVERCFLIHDLASPEEKLPSFIMCFEMLETPEKSV